MNDKKRKTIDPAALNLWNCCGELIAPGAACPKCGKRKSDVDSAGAATPQFEPGDRNALGAACKAASGLCAIDGHLRVTITRGHNGQPLDHDNFVGGCKLLRDDIARALGRDDAEHRGIEWEYRQVPGRVRMVEIQKIEEE